MKRHSAFPNEADSDQADLAETRSVAAASEVPNSDAVPLRQVAQYLDLSISKLKRMIRAGELPEAHKMRTAEGRIWALPEYAMADVAARLAPQTDSGHHGQSMDGYELLSVDDSGHVTIRPEPDVEPGEGSEPLMDLTGSLAEQQPDLGGAPTFAEALDLALLDRLLGVQEQAVLAVADAERAEADVERFSNDHRQAEAALAAERRQRADAEERFHSEQLARVSAESRAAELEMRVRREEALAREERAAASYANMRSLRREREAALATANMSWRGRRRYRRQLSLETSA